MLPTMPRLLAVVLTALVFLAAGASMASAAPGDLDPSFGSGGLVLDSAPEPSNALGLAVQSDGKLIVAGSRDGSWAISRFNADGTPDVLFAGDGEQTLNFGSDTAAFDVLVQSDNKIVAVGSAEEGATSVFGIARLNADGTPDTSFSGDGLQTANLGVDASPSAVGLQSNGRLVVAGYTEATEGDIALARYASDGSLDRSFGADGIRTTDLGGDSDSATDLAIQSDDRIVVTAYPGATLRYTASGNLDPTFSDDGTQTTVFDPELNNPYPATLQPRDVVLQPDGRIVVVGGLYGAATDDPFTTGDQSYGIVRYNTDGSLDTTFSHDGKQAIGFLAYSDPFQIGILPTPHAVALASDGRIVIAGSVDVYPKTDFGLIRVNPNGQLDLSFANNGRLLTAFAQSFASAEAVALQPDGKIVAAGYTADWDNDGNQIDQHLAIVRYEGGGPPPGPQPPRNITPPYINGTPIVGQFVMAPEGFWLGDTPLHYDWQWLRDGDPIPQDNAGNNGRAPRFYPVADEDAGHQLSVRVTATNESGSASLTTAAVRVVSAGGGGAPPTNTSLPQISGTPAVGSTLSASSGSWDGDEPMSFAFQWLRDGLPVFGETGSSYVVQAIDAGHQLAVQVTATNDWDSVSATSLAVSVPIAPPADGGDRTPPDSRSPPSSGDRRPSEPQPPQLPTPPSASTASVGRVRVQGASVVLQLACSAGGGCGKVTATLSVLEHLRAGRVVAISAKKHRRQATRRVVVGRASVQLAAGQRRQLRVGLNRAGRLLLRRFGKLRATLRVAQGGTAVKTTRAWL